MNNERRKILKGCYAELESIKERIEAIKGQVEGVCEDEQEAYENMSESLQDGEKGEVATAAIENMETFINSADDFIEHIEKVEEAAA